MALQALLINLAAGASPWKHAVRVVATSNITLSGLQTIDGVALAEGDRVLVAGQTDAKQNGIYDAKSSAWVRSSDLDDNSELKLGTITVALGGTTHQLSMWVLSSPSTGTLRLGSDNLTFTKLIDVDAVTALGITSTGDLTLTCAAASTIRCFENLTEVCRISDQGGVSHLSFRGAGNARVETIGTTLTVASGSGALILQHNTTDVAQLTVASNVANIAGQGSAGTTFSANTGPARIQCASGSEVRIGEGTTDVAYLRDDAGVAELKLKGAGGNRITSDNFLTIQPAAGQHTSINDGTGTELVTFVANYMRFPTNTPTGTIPAGYAALGFDGTNLILRIGTTNFTIQKV